MKKIESLHKELYHEQEKQSIMDNLLTVVCRITLTTPEDIKGPSRKRVFGDARHLFCLLTKQQSKYAFTSSEIGDFLNRDHATVLNSIKMADQLLKHHRPFQDQFRQASIILNLATNYMTEQEKQEALNLKATEITNLEKWLVDHPNNPYRLKIQQDLREAKAEQKKLLDGQQNAA